MFFCFFILYSFSAWWDYSERGDLVWLIPQVFRLTPRHSRLMELNYRLEAHSHSISKLLIFG